MNLKTGIVLRSTAELNGTFFEGALVLITEYNDKGAAGFVINKPFARTLNELEEFRHSPSFPLYDGGPVGREQLFFIHRRPDLIPGGQAIGNGMYFAGDFKEAIKAINNKSLLAADIRLFIGYCGWDAGELEAEITESSWVPAEGDVFEVNGSV